MEVEGDEGVKDITINNKYIGLVEYYQLELYTINNQ